MGNVDGQIVYWPLVQNLYRVVIIHLQIHANFYLAKIKQVRYCLQSVKPLHTLLSTPLPLQSQEQRRWMHGTLDRWRILTSPDHRPAVPRSIEVMEFSHSPSPPPPPPLFLRLCYLYPRTLTFARITLKVLRLKEMILNTPLCLWFAVSVLSLSRTVFGAYFPASCLGMLGLLSLNLLLRNLYPCQVC